MRIVSNLRSIGIRLEQWPSGGLLLLGEFIRMEELGKLRELLGGRMLRRNVHHCCSNRMILNRRNCVKGKRGIESTLLNVCELELNEIESRSSMMNAISNRNPFVFVKTVFDATSCNYKWPRVTNLMPSMNGSKNEWPFDGRNEWPFDEFTGLLLRSETRANACGSRVCVLRTVEARKILFGDR